MWIEANMAMSSSWDGPPELVDATTVGAVAGTGLRFPLAGAGLGEAVGLALLTLALRLH